MTESRESRSEAWNGKWCTYCRTDTHTDDECSCTRPADWHPARYVPTEFGFIRADSTSASRLEIAAKRLIEAEPLTCAIEHAEEVAALRLKRSKRACTCHPDDNPPRPCPQKFALSECRAAGPEPTDIERQIAAKVGEDPHAIALRRSLLEANEAVVERFVQDYEWDADEEGRHVPTEIERVLIRDAIAGLLSDHEFISTFNAWQDAVRCVRLTQSNAEVARRSGVPASS